LPTTNVISILPEEERGLLPRDLQTLCHQGLGVELVHEKLFLDLSGVQMIILSPKKCRQKTSIRSAFVTICNHLCRPQNRQGCYRVGVVDRACTKSLWDTSFRICQGLSARMKGSSKNLWQLQKGYLWEPQTDCLWQHRLPGQAPPCEPQTSHSTQYDPIQVLQQRPREAQGIVALGCVSTAISPPHRNRLKTRRRMKYLSLA
jgi:hypothetical protein